jgi:hypothetical protein
MASTPPANRSSSGRRLIAKESGGSGVRGLLNRVNQQLVPLTTSIWADGSFPGAKVTTSRRIRGIPRRHSLLLCAAALVGIMPACYVNDTV